MKVSRDICTGCSACVGICPTNALTMCADETGFLFPTTDEKRCVNCGECVKRCPAFNERRHICTSEPECYAAWSKDETVRFLSTSGGVFTHLAEVVLQKGGYVAGAAYREDHLVQHRLISVKKEIPLLRQSKYVQSEIGTVYRDIEKLLKAGKTVLFSGTPCQCAGLDEFLGEKYSELYMCDLICRGVNSPAVYLAYLRDMEKKYNSTVKQIWFKNKTFGWNNFATKIIFEDGQEYLADRETDPYMLGYIKSRLSSYMRPSCYNCRFKGISRPVDITLGDFWGVEKVLPETDTKNGVSAVMIHSEKGRALFKSAGDLLFTRRSGISDIKKYNVCLVESVRSNKC